MRQSIVDMQIDMKCLKERYEAQNQEMSSEDWFALFDDDGGVTCSYVDIKDVDIDASFVTSHFSRMKNRMDEALVILNNEARRDPYFTIEGMAHNLRGTLEYTWRIMALAANGEKFNKYARVNSTIPIMPSTTPYAFTASGSSINGRLVNRIDDLVNTIRPKLVSKDKVIYNKIEWFWIMVLQELRDMSTHRGELDSAIRCTTIDVLDMNKIVMNTMVLSVPFHGFFKGVAKESANLRLDMQSRIRDGENMVVCADAVASFQAIIAAVNALLEEMKDALLGTLAP